MLLAPLRWALRIGAAILALIVVYFSVTLVQVWLTSRHYDPRPAGAIVVMGAAQYNGRPSPDFEARLQQALSLYRDRYAHQIVVTGGKRPGDVYTEAQSGAMYLEKMGVPASDIVQAGGDDSYQNLADTAAKLRGQADRVVLVTTDPFHEDRSMAIASAFDLSPSPTPSQHSPITGWSTVPYFVKEAVGVGFGRIFGFNNIEWLHNA